MLKRVLAVLLLSFAAAPAHAEDCPIQDIEKALSSSLDGLKMIEREVSDVQSTEGGVWRIYREKDGRVHSIVRIDGGESGMGERRLGIVNRKTYGIAVTRVDYMRHAFVEDAGPNGTARRSTDFYYFCGGKLYVPPADYATFDVNAYAAAGREAQDLMVKDKDVADFTKGLSR